MNLLTRIPVLAVWAVGPPLTSTEQYGVIAFTELIKVTTPALPDTVRFIELATPWIRVGTGVGVLVKVAVGVGVGVKVATVVLVGVLVLVGVRVGVLVTIAVAV